VEIIIISVQACLSYQTYQAFLHKKLAAHLEPKDYGSPVISKSDLTKMRKQLTEYKSAVVQDIEEEDEKN
jgi:hypothetical protein